MLFGCRYREAEGDQPVGNLLVTVNWTPYGIHRTVSRSGGTSKIPNAGTNQIQQYVGIQHPVIKHVYLIANKSCCVNPPIK